MTRPAARLVDAHTHFFSRTFFETLARQSPLPGSPEERLASVARATGLEVPPADDAAHLARWLAELDRHGVGHAVTFASLPEEVPVVAEAVARAAGRLTAFGLVNPRAEGAADRAERMLGSLGYRGILLFPAQHHYRVSGPEAAAVLDVVHRRRAVAVVHCGILQVRIRDLLRLPRTVDLSYASPLDLVPAADRFPDAAFVVPHFGAGFLRETLMAGAQCENLRVDTSSSNAWTATQSPRVDLAEAFARALEVFGPDRVLFGTDSSTFPRGWREDVHRAQVAALGRLGVPEAVRDKVLGGNAARLLGL